MSTSLTTIAGALQRVRGLFERRPQAALHEDVPATACWQGGARVVTTAPGGAQVLTDLPVELGGTGDQVSPGWLFRAGLASCAASSIVMAAASAGIALARLEVQAGSRSDARGLLAMADEAGQPVVAGPLSLQLQVRIAAPGVAPQRLRALVEAALRSSPVPSLVRQAGPLALQLDIDGA